MHRKALLIGLIVLSCCLSPAQPRIGPGGEEGPRMLLYEAVPLPADGESGMARVDIHYRIDREFFVPVKNADPSPAHPFVRRGEVLVELVDSSGATARRALERIDIGEDIAERRPTGREWQEGIMSFTLPPGTYRIRISVDDVESRRNILERTRTVTTASPSRPGLPSASLLFVQSVDSGKAFPTTLTPVNAGGELLFGRPAMLALIWKPSAAADTMVSATMTFAQVPPSVEDRASLPAAHRMSVRILRGVRLTPSMDRGHPAYTVAPDGPAALALLPLPADSLLLRAFELHAVFEAGGERKEAKVAFRMLWPDMPFSLRDIDNALDALRYLTTPEQLDSLRHGDLDRRRRTLEEFWRTRDMTPTTAFNEVETEYYRRVDHAMRSFGTLRQPDGFRTDRGRIYVLYGPPTRTERTLDPGAGYQEVWTYERLNRTFTFVDQNRSGNYVLVTTAP
ncbi:MAG: GWxTD domain-containing protein [Bacteroidota bacterium]